ncbi:MAG TPA: hypothetical protein DCS07_02505 [Bdellovibrionales bacterium]|nr:MAG: hypothetical protein A2X97_01190 [Bdellovibrionales bacterium GWA1_52_35]OFZ37088.1 MAG: hypothetical protein A2070_06385 [Bdellovibrionales bacterium GWC1_52_8]HAR41495.1 hypothetical protein [Bdellovibrionales bacterium]HCM39446.1 hypothetical protein [Bdellovibrionales bacterium]
MKNSWLAILFCITAFCAFGCKLPEMTLEKLNAKVDPGVGKSERALLVEDVSRISSIEIQSAPGTAFDLIFGGTNTNHVLTYLDERINYFIPEDGEIDSRLVIVRDSLFPDNESSSKKVMTMATNVGTVLWMIKEASSPTEVAFRFGSRLIQLDSSRVGIIRLGEGYKEDFAPSISRQSTLVHEARHSDCTGGLPRSTIEDLINGKLPEDPACGHLHAICPADHSFAGYAACDKEAWGAYAVEAIFTAVIAKTCTNCSETEKQIALISAADSLSRVLVLEDMLSGRLGPPNMTSDGVRD